MKFLFILAIIFGAAQAFPAVPYHHFNYHGSIPHYGSGPVREAAAVPEMMGAPGFTYGHLSSGECWGGMVGWSSVSYKITCTSFVNCQYDFAIGSSGPTTIERRSLGAGKSEDLGYKFANCGIAVCVRSGTASIAKS